MPSRLTAAAATSLLLVAALGAVPSASASDDGSVSVGVSSTTATVTGLPCQNQEIQISMTNTGSEDVFEDVVVDAPAELMVSRTIFSSYLPAADPDKVVSAPLRINAVRGAAAGAYTVDLVVDGAVKKSVAVTVAPAAEKPDGKNILLHEAAQASSTHSNFTTCALVDGVTSSTNWPKNGWNDATRGTFPDTVTIELPRQRTIGRVVLTTLDRSDKPATRDGLSDADVQLRVNGTWVTVAQVKGNTKGTMSLTFTARQADAVRVIVLGSNADDYSRIVEVQAFNV